MDHQKFVPSGDRKLTRTAVWSATVTLAPEDSTLTLLNKGCLLKSPDTENTKREVKKGS